MAAERPDRQPPSAAGEPPLQADPREMLEYPRVTSNARQPARTAHSAAKLGRASRGSRRWLVIACAALLLACRERDQDSPPFQLRQFKQAQARLSGVFLNEVLVFHFSEALDGSSVTHATLHVRDERGEPAEGDLWVEEERLEFRPRVPLRADLADAGLQPGHLYTVELLGYPLPDGLRSRSGKVLAGCWRGSFRSASEADGSEAPSAARHLFEDASLDRAAPLTLVSQQVDGGASILLACAEPLDPRSVSARGFELRYFGPERAPGESAPQPLPIAIETRLVRNDANGAWLELQPCVDASGVRPQLEPGEYHLWIDPARTTLRDFGGHPCGPAWISPSTPTAEIRVQRPGISGPVSAWRAEFLDSAQRSPKAVDDADGTAHWTDTGLVSVRFPLAAGSGADGAVVLAGTESRADLAATRLSLPAGAVARLAAEQGACVLRAQGRLEIAGELVRACGPVELRRGPTEPHAAWQQRLRTRPAAGPGATARGLGEFPAGAQATLSEFLASASAQAEPWTVLVAGGDLVISGGLRVDGPLLLAAGGWVRASGPVEASEVWILREGGGQRIREPLRQAPLVLDPPTVNPLRVPIHVAIMSAPLRPIRGVERWSSSSVAARSGSGRWRVGYIGERELPGRSVELVGPVDDPSQLNGCSALQVRIDLWMEPGTPWDPPAVDQVEVHWVERGAAPGSSR
jgi:hypothetical protein